MKIEFPIRLFDFDFSNDSNLTSLEMIIRMLSKDIKNKMYLQMLKEEIDSSISELSGKCESIDDIEKEICALEMLKEVERNAVKMFANGTRGMLVIAGISDGKGIPIELFCSSEFCIRIDTAEKILNGIIEKNGFEAPVVSIKSKVKTSNCFDNPSFSNRPHCPDLNAIFAKFNQFNGKTPTLEDVFGKDIYDLLDNSCFDEETVSKIKEKIHNNDPEGILEAIGVDPDSLQELKELVDGKDLRSMALLSGVITDLLGCDFDLNHGVHLLGTHIFSDKFEDEEDSEKKNDIDLLADDLMNGVLTCGRMDAKRRRLETELKADKKKLKKLMESESEKKKISSKSTKKESAKFVSEKKSVKSSSKKVSEKTEKKIDGAKKNNSKKNNSKKNNSKNKKD